MPAGDAEHLREPGHRVGTHGDDPMQTWPLTGVSIGTELHDRYCTPTTRRALSIRSDQGDFVIKVEPTPRLDLCTGDQLYVLDYLADRGFAHAPSVLRTRSGHRAVHIEQGMVCVLELVPMPSSRTTSPGPGVAGARSRRRCAERPWSLFAAACDPVHAALNDLARRAVGHAFEWPFQDLIARAALVERPQANVLIHGEINVANAQRCPAASLCSCRCRAVAGHVPRASHGTPPAPDGREGGEALARLVPEASNNSIIPKTTVPLAAASQDKAVEDVPPPIGSYWTIEL